MESTTREDRKSTRLNSSHLRISYAVFCLKKKRYRSSSSRSNRRLVHPRTVRMSSRSGRPVSAGACPSRSLFSAVSMFFFFFNDTATTEIYPLSLHDALPISKIARGCEQVRAILGVTCEHGG